MQEPVNGRVLDYVPRLDERNNRYLVRDKRGIDTSLWNKSKFWEPPRHRLDQGREGACVGGGVTHEYGCSPVRGRISDDLMFKVYNRAKEIDEWEGVDYDGTSVRAGLLVARELKWIREFWWCKNLDELRSGLEEGPLVVGTEWRYNQYNTKGHDNLIDIGGRLAGWHCTVINGFSPRYGQRKAPKLRLLNSWGLTYGRNGQGYIDPEDFDTICFQAGGEAGVVVGRALAA